MFELEELIYIENELSELEEGIDDYEFLFHKSIKDCLVELKKYREKEIKYEKHGLSKSRLYRIWNGMKNRCYNNNSTNYKNYGGRGIKVCDEWKNSFVTFYYWSVSNGYQCNLTLDRINVEGPYCPENCRWSDVDTQCYNKRNTIKISLNGEEKNIMELSKDTGIDKKIIRKRIKKGVSNLNDLIKPPLKGYNKTLTYNGITKTYKEWEEYLGYKPGTISSRLRNGWTMEEAVTIPKGQHRKKA